MACSMPPMYWSTGSQYAARSSTIAAVVAGAGEAEVVPGRVDEGVHGVRLATGRLPPHFGQLHFRNASLLASGLPLPSGTRSSGSTTGSCSSGTGCTPQVAQWISGIGQPQKRWREMPQSRRRQFTRRLPVPCASKNLA